MSTETTDYTTLLAERQALHLRLSLVEPSKDEKAEVADVDRRLTVALDELDARELQALQDAQRARRTLPTYAFESAEARTLAAEIREEATELAERGVDVGHVGFHDHARVHPILFRYDFATRNAIEAHAMRCREYATLVGRPRARGFDEDAAFKHLWLSLGG